MKFLILDSRGGKANYLYCSLDYFLQFNNPTTILLLVFIVKDNLKDFLKLFQNNNYNIYF